MYHDELEKINFDRLESFLEEGDTIYVFDVPTGEFGIGSYEKVECSPNGNIIWKYDDLKKGPQEVPLTLEAFLHLISTAIPRLTQNTNDAYAIFEKSNRRLAIERGEIGSIYILKKKSGKEYQILI